MDVSRIELYNPNKYNWQVMTAREIIRHGERGVDVPSQYLQWAKDFLNSVYSDDDTTYQVAVSKGNNSTENVDKKTKTNNISDFNDNESEIQDAEKVKDSENIIDDEKKDFLEESEKENTLQLNEDEQSVDVNEQDQALLSGEAGKSLNNLSFVTEKFELRAQKDDFNNEVPKLGIKMNLQNVNLDDKKLKSSVFYDHIKNKSGVENPKNKNLDEENLELENKSSQENQNDLSTEKFSNKSDSGLYNESKAMNNLEQTKGTDYESIKYIDSSEDVSKKSENTHQDINEDIASLMSEIDRVHNEINNNRRKTGSDVLLSNMSKINDLNEYIRRYGTEAQSIAGNYPEITNDYSSDIQDLDQVSSRNSSINARSDEVNSEEELINSSKDKRPVFEFVNKMAGNSSNIESKADIEPINNKSLNTEETSQKLEKDNDVKESDKEVKTSQNDGTDDTDKLNINIDEILKRKIRKGLDIINT